MRRFTARSPSGRPRISACPEVGNTSCMSSFSVVVLPAPLGPRKPKTSPASTSRVKRAVRTFSPEPDCVIFCQLRGGERTHVPELFLTRVLELVLDRLLEILDGQRPVHLDAV